jgi:hypothetical protein
MAQETESTKLAAIIARIAFEMHGADKAAADKMISETVTGTGIWSASVRGLARCLYRLDHLGEREKK